MKWPHTAKATFCLDSKDPNQANIQNALRQEIILEWRPTLRARDVHWQAGIFDNFQGIKLLPEIFDFVSISVQTACSRSSPTSTRPAWVGCSRNSRRRHGCCRAWSALTKLSSMSRVLAKTICGPHRTGMSLPFYRTAGEFANSITGRRNWLWSTPISVPMCRYMSISGDLERMASRHRTMIQSTILIDTLLNSQPIIPDESNDDTFTGH